jgi:hypothetical protein
MHRSLARNYWQIFESNERPIFIPNASVVVSISRPSADVSTTGWTGTPNNTTLFANINESVASDSEYITSPVITGSGDPCVYDITPTLAAGNWDIRFRAWFIGSSAQARLLLLDSSNAVQGTSAWQTVTSTVVPYTAQLTTTGAASRVRIEVQ